MPASRRPRTSSAVSSGPRRTPRSRTAWRCVKSFWRSLTVLQNNAQVLSKGGYKCGSVRTVAAHSTRITNVGTGATLQTSRGAIGDTAYGLWPDKGAADVILLERGTIGKAMRISTVRLRAPLALLTSRP